MTEQSCITLEALGLSSLKSGISTEFDAQKFLMYGQTKLGKTSFWAQCDGAYFIKTERGHNHVDVAGKDCHSYDEVMTVVAKLIQAKQIKPYPFRVVVVDTFDRFIEYIEEAVVAWGRDKYKQSEINSISDIPNGAGWSERTSRLSLLLRRLDEIPCAKAIIMHACVDDMEDERGKFKRTTVNIGGKSNKVITGWADHTMYVRAIYVGDQLLRKVRLRPSREMDAGSRGVLPAELPWTADNKKNFDEFRSFFV